MEEILVELLSLVVTPPPPPVRLIATTSRFLLVKLALLLLISGFFLFINLRHKNSVITMTTDIKAQARIVVMNQVSLCNLKVFDVERASISKIKVNVNNRLLKLFFLKLPGHSDLPFSL